MRTRHALGIGIASTFALSSLTSFADVAAPDTTQQSSAAQVVMVASGAKRGRVDGDMRLRYPGFEQTTVVATKNRIVMITMEAVQEPGKAPVQCSCSSYELLPDGPPRQLVSLKRLTEYSNGERACNHPKAAVDEAGNIVWGYGSDYNSNRPNTYAGILNDKCEHLAAPQMVSIPRNANDGAFDIDYLGNGKFLAGYYSDGGDGPGFPAEGGDYSVAMGLQVNQGGVLPTLTRSWIMPVVTPTNIGRPTVAAVSPDRGLFCAPKGPNRPSDHIECALLDTGTGATLWKSEVARGDRNKKIYFNQPTIAKIDDTHYGLLAIESNGMGKNGNVKGANVSHLFMLERNGDAITVGGELVGAAAHQTHASLCAGAYGDTNQPAVAIFSAAPTGIGRAAMAMVTFDTATKQFKHDPKTDLWPAAWYGDSGHLSNWYGRNPMKQGRDFMRCIGNVPNPGYHQPNGYMADVKTLFVGVVHGRVPGDEKNSLFLSLVPAQMDKKPTPQNPVPAGEKPAVDPNANPTEKGGAGDDGGGCGCTTPGKSYTGDGAALALALGAVVVVVSRRRRRG
jgi:hypothetical protein